MAVLGFLFFQAPRDAPEILGAGLPWTQTTDTNFGAGTLFDVRVFGTGTAGSVGLLQVELLHVVESISQIAAGGFHTIALKTDGTL